MRDLESRIRAVVRKWVPRGYRVVEHDGAYFHGSVPSGEDRKIVCPPLKSRYALMVFLHECAHIQLGHVSDPTVPNWRAEYEAEQFAIKAMRGEGVAVPQDYVSYARHHVRCQVEKALDKDPDSDIDDEVLKWAFPDEWKDIRDGSPLRLAA